MTSGFAGAAGFMVFAIWAATAEMVRLGDQHMSYRAGRLPWSHHKAEILLLGMALFWVMTVIRYRRARTLKTIS